MKKYLITNIGRILILMIGCSNEPPQQETELPKIKQESLLPNESPTKVEDKQDLQADIPKAEVVPQGFDRNDRWSQLIQAGGFKYSHTNKAKFVFLKIERSKLSSQPKITDEKMLRLVYVASANPSFLKDGSALYIQTPKGEIVYIVRSDSRVPHNEIYLFAFDEVMSVPDKHSFTRTFKVFEPISGRSDWDENAEILYDLNFQIAKQI